jgi:hypothetical protein
MSTDFPWLALCVTAERPLASHRRSFIVGITKKILVGVPATAVIGFAGLVTWATITAPTYECGPGMHSKAMEVWNQNSEKQRMLDVWDDEVKDLINAKGKIVISCMAKAKFSSGGDHFIRYWVTEERGTKWTNVNQGPAL